MTEPSKERIAAALALAEAVCALATAVDGDGAVPPELLQARQDAHRAYRAILPKPRTRAEVDAETAPRRRPRPMAEFDPSRAKPETVRELCEQARLWRDVIRMQTGAHALLRAIEAYVAEARIPRTRAEVDAEIIKVARIWSGSHRDPDLAWLQRLCAEHSDSGPSSVDAANGDGPLPPSAPVSPAGAAYSGPPGAAAAKESTDNAVASEGAALEDPEPCGCEEALGLRQKLADIHTERTLYLAGHKSAVDAMGAIGVILRGSE